MALAMYKAVSNAVSPNMLPVLITETAPPKTILLVGPSQNGKSTLGNFLLQGEILMRDLNRFPMGDGMTSCTNHPSSAEIEWNYERIDFGGHYVCTKKKRCKITGQENSIQFNAKL